MKKITGSLGKLLKNNAVYLVLIAVPLALFIKSVFFKFSLLDDDVLTIGRGQFLSNFANIIKSFQEPAFYLTDPASTYYRPILTVFFIFLYKVFGANFYGYHLFNVFLHVLNVLLVYRLLLKLKIEKKAATVSSLIFAVHPIATQAVSWVPGLNDLLLATFFLSSFIYFLNFLETEHIKDLFFFVLFFGFVVFVKESGLLFIFIYVIYLLLFKAELRKFLSVFFSAGFTIGLFLFVRSRVTLVISPSNSQIVSSLLKNVIPGFLVNLGKVFFPYNLSVLPILEGSSLLLGLLSVAILGLLAFFSWKKDFKLWMVGLAIFVLGLLPTFVNPAPSRPLIIFEHRMYVPLFGILLMVNSSKFIVKEFIQKRLYIPIIVALFLITFMHEDKFRDPLAFWQNATLTSPDFYASKPGLAQAYYKTGDIEKAKEILLKLESEGKGNEFIYIYNNLGVIYAGEGNYEKAEEEFNKSIKLNMFSPKAYLNLAFIYKKQGETQKAIEYLRYAIFTDPTNVDAMMNLAAIYVSQGNIEKAQLIYDEVKKLGVQF